MSSCIGCTLYLSDEVEIIKFFYILVLLIHYCSIVRLSSYYRCVLVQKFVGLSSVFDNFGRNFYYRDDDGPCDMDVTYITERIIGQLLSRDIRMNNKI